MADFAQIIEQKTRLPALFKKVTLTAGQKLTDDADVVAFAQRQVPAGKVAVVRVILQVARLEDAE